MFLLIAIAILALMYGYVGWRLIIPAALPLHWNILLWGILVITFFLPFIPVLTRFRGAGSLWLDILAWIGYLSFGFFTLLFAFLVAKDIIMLLVAGFQKAALLFGLAGNSGPEVVDPNRRQILTNTLNLGVLGVTGTLFGYGVYGALRKPKIITVEAPIRNLPPEFEGFRIAQISDIHVSHTIKRPFVQEIVDMVNELQPDLVALTGDLVDGSVDQLEKDVAPLADLKAPFGYYFITGNHEYYSGVEQWLKETARLGFTVLINEHRIITKNGKSIILAGVTDYTGGQFLKEHVSDPHKAISGAPEGLPKILLAHQPVSIYEAAKAGYDYMISGHTHGGQYFPYHFLVALSQPYISGMHRSGDTMVYVNKGTGYWGPQLRIGARSEITLHVLKPA
jgi:predicted MPP superfamily phosphohydrolase